MNIFINYIIIGTLLGAFGFYKEYWVHAEKVVLGELLRHIFLVIFVILFWPAVLIVMLLLLLDSEKVIYIKKRSKVDE